MAAPRKRKAGGEKTPLVTDADRETQRNAPDPDVTELELSYDKLELYAPNNVDRRRIFGFVAGVTCDVLEDTPAGSRLFAMRLASRVNDAAVTARILTWTAQLCYRAGIDAHQAGELALEISARATPDDVVLCFARLCEVADFNRFGKELQS